MRSLKKQSKNLVIILVSVCIISLGVFIQSCSNEEDYISSDEINTIHDTDEYADYTQAMSFFKDEVFEALNSMSVADRNFFLENINDDEIMTLFLEKYNLSNSNIILQKRAYQFIVNTDFDNLNEYEKKELFMTNPLETPGKYATIPRLKSGGEIGTEPCYDAKITAMTIENSIVSVEMLGCTCLWEVPLAACICYAAIMARHYVKLNEIEKDYQDCLSNK